MSVSSLPFKINVPGIVPRKVRSGLTAPGAAGHFSIRQPGLREIGQISIFAGMDGLCGHRNESKGEDG